MAEMVDFQRIWSGGWGGGGGFKEWGAERALCSNKAFEAKWARNVPP